MYTTIQHLFKIYKWIHFQIKIIEKYTVPTKSDTETDTVPNKGVRQTDLEALICHVI